MKMFVEVPAIYLYPGHVDFRKSINCLVLIIEQDMAYSPSMRPCSSYATEHRDKVKALYWDKTGFCLWYKRLERDFSVGLLPVKKPYTSRKNSGIGCSLVSTWLKCAYTNPSTCMMVS